MYFIKKQKGSTCRNFSKKNLGGFTLIELLVVIAIISVLASVVMSSLNTARKKAQNAQRISQLVQIRKALEMYYNDHGAYPLSHPAFFYRRDCNNTMTPVDPNTIIPGLVPTYMGKITSDPAMVLPTSNAGCLNYGSDGKDYSVALISIPGFTNADYAAYPAFIPPYRDGGADRCSRDGSTYNVLAVWSEKACEQILW